MFKGSNWLGRARRCKPMLEALEDRLVPSTIWSVNASATGTDTGLSWANAFPFLQSALTVAQPGDQIWVAKDTYKPTTGTDRTISFNLDNGVAVYGGFAGTETSLSQRNAQQNVTILSGDIGAQGNNTDNSYNVVTANGLTSGLLDGFTITGGNANLPSSGNFTQQSEGGGLYIGSGSLTLSNLIFSGNSAVLGGGLYNNLGTATLTNVSFSGNSALAGGGMDNRGTATLTNVGFSGNVVHTVLHLGGGDGGGLNNGGTATLTNVSFSGNSGSAGGGMDNFGIATLTNVSFSGNSGGGGGGLYNDRTATLTNVSFINNFAGAGGGMDNYQGTATLTNVSFSGNSATNGSGGGGMYNGGTATLTNVSFSGNSTGGDLGGGVLNGGTATLTNCILWGDIGGEIVVVQDSVNVSYSDIQGGYAGTGNINADPFFVDPTHGNLHLQAGSPAIDTGTNAGAPNFDMDGNPRPVDATGKPTAITDMGAYEFQNPLPLPLVAVGTQAGVPAYVALYNAAGQRYTMQPFGSTFTGGIRVAVADINQDGVDDLIVTPGPGGTPTVKVYSGSNGALVDSFNAYGSSFTGGLFVAAADVLDRGSPQVVVGPGEGGSPYAQLWDLRNGPTLAQSLQVFDNSFTGGLTVGASNGLLVAGAASQSANVKVFDQPNLSRVRLFAPFGIPFAGGVTVAANGQYLAVGQMAGTSLVNVFNLLDLSLTTSVVPEFGIPHDPASVGGTSVNWTREANGAFDLLTGSGPGWPAKVQYWVAGTWVLRTSFEEFGGYPGGIWVA